MPAPGINLWIFDPHVQFERVVRNAPIAFLQMHLIAMRVAEMIDPCSVVVADRIDDKGVSFPVANRISPPSGQIDFLRELPSIRPDRAPRVGPLKVLNDSVRKHNEFDRIRIDERTRYALRIAGLIKVRTVRWRNSSAAADVFLGMRFGIVTS